MLASGRPFRKARQSLPLGEPRHVVRSPDVHHRPDRRIIVEGRDAKHDMRLACALGEDVRAAHRAESPHSTGRRFEGRKLFGACDQMKMIPRDPRRRRVRSRMRFAAGRTVTIADRGVEAVDLVTHRSAQAASFQGHGILRAKYSIINIARRRRRCQNLRQRIALRQQARQGQVTREAACGRNDDPRIGAVAHNRNLRSCRRIQIHLMPDPQISKKITAPSAARCPSRSATAAVVRSPATRMRAALPAPGRESAARYRRAGCRPCRRRARPRRRRFR